MKKLPQAPEKILEEKYLEKLPRDIEGVFFIYNPKRGAVEFASYDIAEVEDALKHIKKLHPKIKYSAWGDEFTNSYKGDISKIRENIEIILLKKEKSVLFDTFGKHIFK